MSDKRTKNTAKSNKKPSKIDDIDIDKITVFDKKLYNKEHDSYKYYVFYKHIPLRIILNDFAGYYNVYKYAKYDAKKMNFKLDDDDDSLDKVYDFLNILRKN